MKNNPFGKNQNQGRTGADSAAYNARRQNPGAANQPNPGQYQAGNQTGKKPVIVWVKSGDVIHRARVVTGAIDATNAEIKYGIKEGDEVILSMSLGGKPATATAAATPTTTSPFMPQRPPQGATRR